MDNHSVARHPIRVVAHRTGLTPATIRAWERRYDAVSPTRTEGRHRLYSDRDVERLRVLKALSDAGRSISMIAELTDLEATSLLAEDQAASPTSVSRKKKFLVGPGDWVDQCYRQIEALDAEGLERMLGRGVVALDGAAFLGGVAEELLERVGGDWAAGGLNQAQQDLASEISDRVLKRLDSATPAGNGPTLVVAAVERARLGLGARLASIAAILERWRVVRLGSDLPAADIAGTVRGLGARGVVVTVADRLHAPEAIEAVAALRRRLAPDVALLMDGVALAGNGADDAAVGTTRIDGLGGEALRALFRGEWMTGSTQSADRRA